MCAMRNSLPFISPCPLATTASKASRNSFTILLESVPSGAQIAVSAAAREDAYRSEQLALHLALSIGHHSVKGFAKLLHNLARVGSVRRANSGQRSRRRRRIQLQSQSLRSCPRHLRTKLGIVYELFPPGGQLSVAHAAHELKRRSQRREQRCRWRIGRLALRRRLPLLAQIKVIPRRGGR